MNSEWTKRKKKYIYIAVMVLYDIVWACISCLFLFYLITCGIYRSIGLINLRSGGKMINSIFFLLESWVIDCCVFYVIGGKVVLWDSYLWDRMARLGDLV